MADIIVQPKVLNADGVTYDNLIMQQSVYAEYASTDTSKGTIEERLTNLGFKSGNITNADGDVVGTITRQGNYVLANISTLITIASGGAATLTFTRRSFSPSSEKIVFYLRKDASNFVECRVSNTGYMQMRNLLSGVDFSWTGQFGWEAPPIE